MRALRTFLILWFGQSVSTIGSALTSFAIGVWVYQYTHQVTSYALIVLSAFLPQVLLAPLAGALTDRWDRRVALIVGDIGAGLGTLTLAIFVSTGSLQLWQIYALAAFSSAFGTLHWPAFSAITSTLVPKEHYGRASGLNQVAEAVSSIAAAPLGAFLLVWIGLQGIIIIDFATFGFAILASALVRVPRPERVTPAEHRGLRDEALFGFRFIRARPGLLALLGFFCSINLIGGFFSVLMAPLILSIYDAKTLGLCGSCAGFGMLAGTIGMSIWGGPKRRVHGVLGGGLVSGLLICLLAAPPTVPFLCVVFFLTMTVMPVLNASSQAIWMAKTPQDVQGKVFAARRVIAQALAPVSIALAGPMVDRVFSPSLALGGFLHGSVGQWISGPGAGIRFAAVVMGMLSAGVSIGAYLLPRLRHLEDELPDAPAPLEAVLA